MHFTDKKYQVFNSAIYDKIICYCQTDAKTEFYCKIQRIVRKMCQTAELNFLQLSYFKMTNFAYLALYNASWQSPRQYIGQ